ncbi:hypothetical protein ABZ901_03710 [Actinacidiphila alni]|uniref:hypothetical protein n=1 Tax=Actinacidiphila alni TaxID=380248 RepID=UPI0033E2296C
MRSTSRTGGRTVRWTSGRRRGAGLLAAAFAVPLLLLGAPASPAAADAPAAPGAGTVAIEATGAVTLPPMVTRSARTAITIGFGKDRPGHPTGPRTITVDTSGAAAVVDFFQFPDCERGATEDIHVCTVPHKKADGSDTVTFTASAAPDLQGGAARLITYTGSWGGVPATPASTRVRVGTSTDLRAAAPRPVGVKPSSGGSLTVGVTDKGLVGADAFVLTVQVTSARLALVKDPACTYDTQYGRDRLTCRYDVPVAPGQTVAVRPVRFTTRADSFNEEVSFGVTALVSPGPGEPPAADHDPYWTGTKVRVVTGADFRATGAHLTGPVGARLMARFSFVNAGPAATDDGPGMYAVVTVPQGTEAVDVPRVCVPTLDDDGSQPDPGRPGRYQCPFLNGSGAPGIAHTLDFTFRIVSADAAPGSVTVKENSHGHPTDPDLSNNTAPITVTVTSGSASPPSSSSPGPGSGPAADPGSSAGELAASGAPPVALIAAAAVAALALGGAVAYTSVRRRR